MISHQGHETQLRSRRIPFSERVQIAPRNGDERRSEESFDLSLGGMFVTSILPLNVGELVDLSMPLDSIRFQTPARVVWVRGVAAGDDRPVGMAVKFVELNQHQKRLVHRQIINHTRAGGQLKIGSPPTNDPRSATTPASRPPAAETRPPSTHRTIFDSASPWWLMAGAAAVAITAVLLILLI